MGIAQRFSAGSDDGITSSPKRAAESGGNHQTGNVCRPFHGLAILFFILIPALKRWAIPTSSAVADEPRELLGSADRRVQKPSTAVAPTPSASVRVRLRLAASQCGKACLTVRSKLGMRLSLRGSE